MRVEVETRKAFYVRIGGVRRRFWDEPTAYKALAKSLLLKRYGWLNHHGTSEERYCVCDRYEGVKCICAAMPEWLDLAPDRLTVRKARFDQLFMEHEVDGQTWFNPAKWSAYVRRVARKMRAMDRARRP